MATHWRRRGILQPALLRPLRPADGHAILDGWGVDLFLPNLGFGRLVVASSIHSSSGASSSSTGSSRSPITRSSACCRLPAVGCRVPAVQHRKCRRCQQWHRRRKHALSGLCDSAKIATGSKGSTELVRRRSASTCAVDGDYQDSESTETPAPLLGSSTAS
jgi:hypothetical protein